MLLPKSPKYDFMIINIFSTLCLSFHRPTQVCTESLFAHRGFVSWPKVPKQLRTHGHSITEPHKLPQPNWSPAHPVTPEPLTLMSPPPGTWVIKSLDPTFERDREKSSFTVSIFLSPPRGLCPVFSRDPIFDCALHCSFVCVICKYTRLRQTRDANHGGST